MIQRFGNLSKEVLNTMIHKAVKENFPQKYKIKEKQKSAIITALQGYDTFIQMPTGFFKKFFFIFTFFR